jgi:hypothetical protein
MKILLSLIILFVPISILAKQICLAPSGCAIEMDTGFCPKCIEVDEPIIKEGKVVVEKKPIVKIPQKQKVSQSKDRKPIKRERNWVGTLFECIVGCKENVKYWDEGGNEFDKNLNLISTN